MIQIKPGAALAVVALAVSSASVSAQNSTSGGQSGQPVRVTVPTVTVTAQKEPADIQSLPVSVTAVTGDTLRDAGIEIVSEAGIFAPNTHFTEFTARKLSNARFRGIGSSPANPGITTYIDGVPQLNANSSSADLLDIGQIEFVRGGQGALFGRNTLGGFINVVSDRPSLTKWTGTASVPFGNYSAYEVKAGASGPLSETLAVGVSVEGGERDGFTTNDLTGNDLDYRSSFAGKAQLLWTPASEWEARVIVSGERARDGDYALNDLAALRQQPFHAMRDFEGHTDRDLWSTTIQARRQGPRFTFASTTGFVNWKTRDLTDLDYLPLPYVTRDNLEKDLQFTQEVRIASAGTPIKLSDGASLRWQSGVFVFTQNYDQDAVNTFAPGLISPMIPFSVSQHSPQSELDDVGFGVYGQGTITFRENLDLLLGARADHESKEAALNTFYAPTIAPPTTLALDKGFSDVSPQFAAAYRVRPNRMIYGSASRGFKAGGFNPASPPGTESFDQEHAWHFEGGTKTAWAEGRVLMNAAVFHIEWDDLQLNLPNLSVPGQFYITNAGNAHSSGVEFELRAKPHTEVDLFASLGYTHARLEGSSLGVNVAGNEIPNTPDYTATLGAQLSRGLGFANLYGRGDVVFYGAFKYDESNTQGQEAYSLTNLRGGLRGKYVFAEAWIKNAFDTRYIPVAFAYQPFAPSGYIGEMGRPRTFGLSAGLSF
jgi:iron complex outermembrane receptor protein